jgi:predicted enzyme related to lactoylglutathione lyase
VSLGFETADLDAVAARLTAAGAQFPPPREHAEGFRELVVHDPDGNTLRLFSWPLRRG